MVAGSHDLLPINRTTVGTKLAAHSDSGVVALEHYE